MRENPVAATQELLMEPTVAAGQYDLRGLRIDLLRTAAEIYRETRLSLRQSSLTLWSPHDLARRLHGRRSPQRAPL